MTRVSQGAVITHEWESSVTDRMKTDQVDGNTVYCIIIYVCVILRVNCMASILHHTEQLIHYVQINYIILNLWTTPLC